MRSLRALDRLRPVIAASLGIVVGLGVVPLVMFGAWWGFATAGVLAGAAYVFGRRLDPKDIDLFSEKERVTEEAVAEPPSLDHVAVATDSTLDERRAPFTVIRDPLDLFDLKVLPGGDFVMGSPDDDSGAYSDEKPQHPVQVSSFTIGTTPVTRATWRAVMHAEPKAWKNPGKDDALLPANHVSWHDAVRFCETATDNAKGDGTYRLATEAEWEYACRAGTTTPWFSGESADELERFAWHDEGFDSDVHAVGEKDANPWGLFDMIGNVWEWCRDEFDDDTYETRKQQHDAGNSIVDPIREPEGPAPLRAVLRGGSFVRGSRSLRSACRRGRVPGVSDRFFGFRCVWSPRRLP